MGSPTVGEIVFTKVLMMAGLPEWWGARHPERMGNTPTSPFALPPDHQGRVQGRRRASPSPRPAGQTAGLRRPPRLQALLDDGWSISQLASQLATTQAAVRRAIQDHHVRQPPCHDLARQRQRVAQQRIAARVGELGFEGVRAYLVGRLVTQAWTLEELVGEVGAAPATLRRLLDRYQVRRVAPARRQRAAATAARGPTTPPRVVERRRARLAEVGSAEVDDCLRDRFVGGAGRCGGCVPNSASVMAGWTGT